MEFSQSSLKLIEKISPVLMDMKILKRGQSGLDNRITELEKQIAQKFKDTEAEFEKRLATLSIGLPQSEQPSEPKSGIGDQA
jgi:hypothetical protein